MNRFISFLFSSLLFLRVGYIVGNAGILYTFLMLIVSYTILICTACSISAIATNGSVKGGGVYFMISRTLGPQLGGAVGILFYLANVVSGALYASGFAETFLENFGSDGRLVADWAKLSAPQIAAIVLTVILVICLVGGKVFSKCTVIFAILLLVAFGDLLVSYCQDSHVSVNYCWIFLLLDFACYVMLFSCHFEVLRFCRLCCIVIFPFRHKTHVLYVVTYFVSRERRILCCFQ